MVGQDLQTVPIVKGAFIDLPRVAGVPNGIEIRVNVLGMQKEYADIPVR